MKIISDLHIHSRFSRATSKTLNIPNLEKYAKIKGLDLLGTGDFTHPEWLKELKKELTEDGTGILKTKSNFNFLLQTEISLIYTDMGKGRRIHNVILAPSFELADQITEYFKKHGRVDYDGRPIFKIPCHEMTESLMQISKDIEIIPAHILTPWFSLFGSMSGYDDINDAFKDQVKHIHALETGLSSDPAMDRRISALDKFALVSFSDLHCVHPNTPIILENGKVAFIKEISNKNIISYMDKNRKLKNGIKIQLTKIPAPPTLLNIKFKGGEIKVSKRHRFFIYENREIKEKRAVELEKGNCLIKISRLPHEDKGSKKFKPFNYTQYVMLNKEGLNELKKLRIKHNFTQNQLAKKLGLYIDHYWKIEKGKIKLNLHYLRQLSKILRFDYGLFLSRYKLKITPQLKVPEKSSPELCQLLGYIAGDACKTVVNRGLCLKLSDKDKQNIEFYGDLIKKVFSQESRMNKCSSKNSYELTTSSLIAKFVDMIAPETLFKSRKVLIPDFIFDLPKGEISAFLRGFFDAEGTTGHHFVSVCSSNLELINQISALLLKFGIKSSIYKNYEKTKKKFRYNLNIYGLDLKEYYKHISFDHNKKRRKLNKYLNTLRIKRPSYKKLSKDFDFTPIMEIKEIDSDCEYLYDIAVPGAQNYIASNIVVHNSFWPWRIGREATVFDCKLSYDGIIESLKNKKIDATIEVDPNYGKYHLDGHRLCNVCLEPSESIKNKNICPKCGRKLTIGVLHRVQELADREEGYKPKDAIPFKSLIPLSEILASLIGASVATQKTWKEYHNLINKFGSEFNVLLEAEKEELSKITDEKIAEAIIKNREGKIKIRPGYDGVYGFPIFENKIEEEKINEKHKQKGLDEFY